MEWLFVTWILFMILGIIAGDAEIFKSSGLYPVTSSSLDK